MSSGLVLSEALTLESRTLDPNPYPPNLKVSIMKFATVIESESYRSGMVNSKSFISKDFL